MTKTYTFTARDGLQPERTVTLTLYPEIVRINLTGLWDQLGRVASAEDKSEEVKSQLQSKLEPAALKLLETISGPVHIRDFNASQDGDRFSIHIWQRVRGLRAVPLFLVIDPVDNTDAAAAFLEELAERKLKASRAARFPGLFDYWITWIGLFSMFMAVFFWLQKKRNGQD